VSEPFIAEIRIFAGNFAPRGWAFCDGQLLAINSYQALFSLMGTTFGGDGRTSFGLPDLRGRVPVHPGSGPGLTPRSWGQRGGQVSNTFSTQRVVREHAHSLAAGETLPSDSAVGNTETVVTRDFSVSGNVDAQGTVPNLQPYLGINFIIALTGIFPSRN
jgi:microcystin-dependent protein